MALGNKPTGRYFGEIGPWRGGQVLCPAENHSTRPWARGSRRAGALTKGHFNYYGITGNFKAIASFAYLARAMWKKWLSRRSQKAALSWEAMAALLKRFPLPPPKAKRSNYRKPAATPVI